MKIQRERSRSVLRNRLQMWLGFVAFFAFFATLSVVGSFAMGLPLQPVGVTFMIVLLVVFVLLLRRYRSLG